MDISPYKYVERKENIVVLPAPAFADNVEAGLGILRGMAERTKELHQDKEKIAAFFLESGMSVAGVILPSSEFVREAYALVKEKLGGLCVADEVQVGLGRLGGECFFGWQKIMPKKKSCPKNHEYVYVPDIITIGKPFGNGMPLAALITRSEIANCLPKEYLHFFCLPSSKE